MPAKRSFHEEAEAMIDALARQALNPAQNDYLGIISDMVDAHAKGPASTESKPDPVSLIKYLMQEHEINGEVLAKLPGMDCFVAYRILKGDVS